MLTKRMNRRTKTTNTTTTKRNTSVPLVQLFFNRIDRQRSFIDARSSPLTLTLIEIEICNLRTIFIDMERRGTERETNHSLTPGVLLSKMKREKEKREKIIFFRFYQLFDLQRRHSCLILATPSPNPISLALFLFVFISARDRR